MYHIIINPASKSGKGLKIWKESVEPALLKEETAYRCYFSKKEGDVEKLTGTITRSAETVPVNIIILGGDGTMNEALQGIRNLSNVILGYIPTGSSNDLARDLKISQDPLTALDTILHTGTVQPMDLGTVIYPNGEKRRFAVSCGIGFDAAVCEEALHSRIKNTLNRLGLGKLTYLGIALRQLFTAKAASCELTLEDNSSLHINRFLFVTCMIHRFEGGGFQFCPDADPRDGILNLCAVGGVAKPLILLALPTAFWGKHYFVKNIRPFKARRVHVRTSSPLWVHTDGEVKRRTTEFSVTCEQGALNLIL